MQPTYTIKEQNQDIKKATIERVSTGEPQIEIFQIEVLENEKIRNLEQIASLEKRNLWLDERINEASKLK